MDDHLNEKGKYIYVNKFAIAASQDGSEVMVKFWKRFPDLSPSGEMDEGIPSDAASIVMTGNNAMTLAGMLIEHLGPLKKS